ncbi:conjugal transfer protein TraG [Salmonella enterica subsp. salamae]|nr:conjugal transfer protein TraG [Salmonella enterica subsp. salamae]
MTTNSYLEYFLTLLGWVVNNGLWNAISATGLFALPLLIKLLALWLQARSQGADEGNKAALSLIWTEHLMYTSLQVIMFTCVPMLNIDLDTIKYDTTRSKQCGMSVPQPADTGYQPIINSLGGKTAAVPVWWYFVHVISKGITSATVATLPCQPDLRQIRFEVQHTRIKDPVLAQELRDFVEECYAPSRVRLKFRAGELDDDTSDDTAWLGSSYFLNTAGYYDTDHALSPHSVWPYSASRDAGLADTGAGGYPTCKQWWADDTVGLKARLLQLPAPDIWTAFKKIGQSQAVYEEAVLRSLVSERNMQVSQNGRVYPGYGGNVDGTVANAATRLASSAGNILGSIAAFPAFDSVRQALPMVQALLQMALVTCIPLITLCSAWDVKVVMTLTFVQFALFFLTFWWELARWLDSWLLDVLYSSDTHSSWNLAGIQNTQDDVIINLVMGSMFLVLPTFWMGAMTWAGVRVGVAVNGALAGGVKVAQDSGGKAGGMIGR